MDPFNPTTTPGRKLRTYGRSSRTATTATPLRRASSSTQTPDPFVAKEPLVSVVDKSKARVTKVEHGKTAASSTARAPAKTGSVTATRTGGSTVAAARNGNGAAGKKRDQRQDDVFDFPSSDDELLAAAEPWRKRRRLSTPAAASRRPSVSVQKKRAEEDGSEARRVQRATTPARKKVPVSVPAPETGRRESKRLKTQATSTKKRAPDVVVKVAPKENATKVAKGTVPMPTIAESKTPRKPTPADTGGLRKAPTRTASIPVPAESKTPRKPAPTDIKTGRKMEKLMDVDVVDSLFGNKPILDAPKLEPTKRSQVLGSPASKLRSITKHLSPMKKPPGFGSVHSDTNIPGTVSRTRLVDALGSKRRYSSDSSDSESEIRRSTSRSPSAGLDDTQTTTFDDDHQALTNPRRAPASSQRVTYARQRSFLTETNRGDGDVDPLGDLATPLLPESPRKLSKFKSSTSWDFEEDEEGNSTRTIRSVYELRQAGSNARYQGVIETIFEDLEDTSTSLSCKRSGLMQLCTRLTDYQFAHKFLSSSLDKRLAKCTSGLSDVISAFLLAYIYALLLSTGPASPIVLRTCSAQISRIAPVLLKEKRDVMVVAKQGDAKMTKAGYSDLKALGRSIQSSKIWSETKPRIVSPQILALRCKELAIRRIRETGDTVESLTTPVLKQVVELLLQQPLPEDTESDGVLVVELCLSILESYTVGLGQLEPRQESVLRGLAKLGPLLSDLTRQAKTNPRQRQLQGLEIRLVLNITNNNPRLCDDFSTPELIRGLSEVVLVNFESVEEELNAVLGEAATVTAVAGRDAGNYAKTSTAIGNGVDKKESLLDTVILALGALINLTEWSGTARRLVLDSHGEETVSNTKTMKQTRTTLLDGFVRLFTEGWEGVSEVSFTFPTDVTSLSVHEDIPD